MSLECCYYRYYAIGCVLVRHCWVCERRMLVFIMLAPFLALGVADLLRGFFLGTLNLVLINLGPRGGSEGQDPLWIRGVGHRCWGM